MGRFAHYRKIFPLHVGISTKGLDEQLTDMLGKKATRQTRGLLEHHKKRYHGSHSPGIHPSGYTRLTKRRG